MKDWDKDWIHFSKKTRRGIFVLLIIFILIAISPRLYYNYFASVPDYDVQISKIPDRDHKGSRQDKNHTDTTGYVQPQNAFDPNEYSIDEWMAIGLTQKQAQSILNYLNTGARFQIKSDLKKSYVIDSSLYKLLESKIKLPISIEKNYDKEYKSDKAVEDKEDFDSLENKNYNQQLLKSDGIDPLQINIASKSELEKIRGIGPFFAEKIIEMRNEYGGIIAIDQLLEIYNMDDEKLNKIAPFLIIDRKHVKKKNINTASEDKLRQHPLISIDMAHSIVYFRENHKPYKSLDELLLSPYIDSKMLKKLEPYLKVE